jgi:hypothetical protein
MSKSFKINGELIISSGQKLKKVGYLMIGYIVLYVFNFLVTINSTDIEVIQFMSVLTLVVSIILTIMIIQNIIESGTGLIKSVQKEGIHEGYYPNGKLSYKGTYKFGKKDGTWDNITNGVVSINYPTISFTLPTVFTEHPTNREIFSNPSYPWSSIPQ